MAAAVPAEYMAKNIYASSSIRSSSRGRRSRNSSSILPQLPVSDFKYGLVNYYPPQQISRGAASDELNMLTRGTKVETRNGYTPVGPEINGNGKSTGVFTAHKWDGTEVLVRTRTTKIEYYDPVNNVWIEIGTDLLAGITAGEPVSFAEYSSAAGAQMWVSSPSSVLLKVMTANMAAVDQYSDTKNFKGNIRIKQNRMFLWGYLGNTLGKASNAALRLSFIDSQNFNAITGESIGTGDGVTKTFNNTLAALGGPKTAFGIEITDGVEIFVDDYMGNLVGNLGGTGTVNYATGVFSVTFNTAPLNMAALTAAYSTEDSTDGGIADFTESGTRLAGEGAIFQQNDGGKLLNVYSFDGDEYCMHERKAWILTLGTDDTTATNLIYRDKMALASLLGGVATADGIYYVDTTIQSRPYVAVLTLDKISSLVLPKDLSSTVLDLSGFSFDQCAAGEWDKYIYWFCRTQDSATNNRMLLLNKDIGCFDIVDFYGNTSTTYGGTLVSGDSATVNVYQLFSGFDDNGANPAYSWTGNIDDHGIGGLKKSKQLWVEGEIDENQSVDVYAATDFGGMALIGTISGKGSYVDKGQAILVGSVITGSTVVGGGSNGLTAFHYLTQIKISILGKYKYLQLQFVPTGLGYFSFTMYNAFDIRTKEDKLPLKYRS